MKNDDLTYIDDDGNTVFKTQFHRNRGRCCKSTCLHCPYGTTIEKLGLKFENSNETKTKELFDKLYVIDDFTSNLMGNAFGNVKKIKFDATEFYILYLKGVECGIAQVVDRKVKSFKLLEHFLDQGIDKDVLQTQIN